MDPFLTTYLLRQIISPVWLWNALSRCFFFLDCTRKGVPAAHTDAVSIYLRTGYGFSFVLIWRVVWGFAAEKVFLWLESKQKPKLHHLTMSKSRPKQMVVVLMFFFPHMRHQWAVQKERLTTWRPAACSTSTPTTSTTRSSSLLKLLWLRSNFLISRFLCSWKANVPFLDIQRFNMWSKDHNIKRLPTFL